MPFWAFDTRYLIVKLCVKNESKRCQLNIKNIKLYQKRVVDISHNSLILLDFPYFSYTVKLSVKFLKKLLTYLKIISIMYIVSMSSCCEITSSTARKMLPTFYGRFFIFFFLLLFYNKKNKKSIEK